MKKTITALIFIFSVSHCYSQSTGTISDSLWKLLAVQPIGVYDTSAYTRITYDTVLALVCLRVPNSIPHTKMVVVKRNRIYAALHSDLKGRKLDNYFFIMAIEPKKR